MILSYLLESGERNHNLDQLSQRLLDHTMIPITDLIGKGKNQRRWTRSTSPGSPSTPARTPTPPGGSRQILAPKVRAEGLWNLYAELERPLISVLARMETAGVKVDVAPAAAALGRVRRAAGDDRGRDLRAGRPTRSTSTRGPQLRQVLFEELKLPSLQKTPGRRAEHRPGGARGAGAPSTPCPALLIQHRQLAKLKSTYLDALPGAGAPRGRPDPRLVQPEGGGDRPAQLERPEPPEHPGPDRGRPPDPPGVRRRASRAGRS